MQGGIHPDLSGDAYFDIVREVKRRVPDMHVHAFRPNGGRQRGGALGDVGARLVDGGPRGGAGLDPRHRRGDLDDDVRWLLTKGKLPASEWIDVISTAHEVGLRSSSTMMFGHVDNPAHCWGTPHAGLHPGPHRRLHRIRRAAVHPHQLADLPRGAARPGPTRRENRAVHAMARILLHGRIDNIQCSW